MARKARNKSQTRRERVLDSAAAIRGIERKEHFAAGGSARAWRPAVTTTKNNKAEARRKACRGRVTY